MKIRMKSPEEKQNKIKAIRAREKSKLIKTNCVI